MDMRSPVQGGDCRDTEDFLCRCTRYHHPWAGTLMVHRSPKYFPGTRSR
jgi:hypothetical protein